MKVISGEEIRRSVGHAEMVEALREGFRSETMSPLRHNHKIARPQGESGVLLLMPSWNARFGCVKLVNVVADNGARGLPSVVSNILLFDVDTGAHLALIDGEEATGLRTAAASALAADYLARGDATQLLVVGGGKVAARVPHAYRAVRRVEKVRVWNRRRQASEALARQLAEEGFDAEIAEDLEVAVGQSDMISCATLAKEPLIRGAWLRPGQHLDLIGSFLPDMREADDDAIARASVFVDTEAAIAESGEIIGPMESGVLAREGIRGGLHDLCRGKHGGRAEAAEITLFKSVGAALEDLAAAQLIYRRLAGG